MDTLEVGYHAEQQACRFLEKKGLKLLARNYRCLFGEIDLIMRYQDEIVFVEVRKRTNTLFATPVESVTRAKQRKIIKTAMHYLQKLHGLNEIQYRFDIVGITEDKIEWIQDAFCAEPF